MAEQKQKRDQTQGQNQKQSEGEEQEERQSQGQGRMQADHVSEQVTVISMFVRLWPFFRRQKALIAVVLGAVFAMAAAGRLSVTVFGMAIDKGILKNDISVVYFAAVAYLMLEVGRSFMTFLQGYLFSKLGNRILFELRERLIDHVQHLPVGYFDRTPSGRIVTRVTNDVVALGELFTQGLISVFAAVVSLSAIIFAMTMISWKMTVATLAIAPPLIWFIVRISRKIFLILRESKTKLAAINSFVAENIAGMRVLQLYGRVGKNSARFDFLSGDYRRQQLLSIRHYAMLWPAASFFNASSVAAALYAGGTLAIEGTVTPGAMIAFVLHVRAFVDPIHTILEKYQVFQNCLSGAERIFTLLAEKTEGDTASSLVIGGVGTASGAGAAGAGTRAGAEFRDSASEAEVNRRFKGQIEFRDVTFCYGVGLANALDKVDLHIHPGESIALVGRTGSGKSTMISLLQRLYEPSLGSIVIDGVPITSISRQELRRRVGVIQQDVFMFRGSIADNISLGDLRISRAQIEEAAEQACLGSILERHSGGLDAKVEERGANLSVGERQLIAFARILAFNPDILILDEATANIDSLSERLIQEATRRVRIGRTCLIVAHRISTIVDCHRIFVLSRGKITESGSHSELFASNGRYRQLCQAQSFVASGDEAAL